MSELIELRKVNMHLRLITLLSIFLSVSTPVDASEADEVLLRHFKTIMWPTAYKTQDVELLDRMLHPSFQMIDDAGNRSTKEKELDYIKNNHWNPRNFVYSIERLDIYDSRFAVIDGTGETDTYTYKSSNYMIKEDGQWRAIGSHVSGFREKKENEQ
jgi:hypothetical protein